MGQAKNKGNYEQRVLIAKERMNKIRPKFLTCNSCKTDIHQVNDLDVRGLKGIEGGFATVCPECKTTTYAFKGEPEAVSSVLLNLQEFLGGESEFGVTKVSGMALE